MTIKDHKYVYYPNIMTNTKILFSKYFSHYAFYKTNNKKKYYINYVCYGRSMFLRQLVKIIKLDFNRFLNKYDY